MDDNFHKKFKIKAHAFIKNVYEMSEFFPHSELYGTVSQLRRAAISIMLNYVEGFARFKPKVKLNFYEISYGSAKECLYLLFFAFEKKWISRENYLASRSNLEEINKMLWSIIKAINNTVE